jgi:ribosomal protein S18 acetylase RimI-like enzyme
MKDFPNNFSETTESLPLDEIGDKGREFAEQLAAKGYEVRHGLTTAFADAITAMANEPAIREYCPKDCTQRFANREVIQSWLSKKRATFLLLKNNDQGEQDLVGYGWVGTESSDLIPTGQTTFAIRIGEAGQGQGLATPFAWLIVAGAAAIYGARDVWLETWQSNGGAVHVYHKIGFQDVAQVEDDRPTISGQSVKDTRLYMALPNELLP